MKLSRILSIPIVTLGLAGASLAQTNPAPKLYITAVSNLPVIGLQVVDLTGWYLHAENSGSLILDSNRWQHVELISGSNRVTEGIYTAIQRDSASIQIDATPDHGTNRTWVLHFDGANAGTYALDYTSSTGAAVHEEGRVYRSTAGMSYADWAQMTRQTQSNRIWEYLTGLPPPRIQPARHGNLLDLPIPAILSGRIGFIDLEESLALKDWSACTGPVQIGAGDSRRFYRLKAGLTRRPRLIAAAAIPVVTTTLTPASTTTLSGFTTIASLQITAGTGTPVQIHVTETPKPPAMAQIVPLTGLIGIEGLETLAETPYEVRVNVAVPKDHFAMGFIYDRATGSFEGMPLKELADDHVTVLSRHFCDFLILGIPVGALPDEVDGGFRPGVDDWEFTNYGSYVAPGGHCAGQDISAMYYYVTERQKKDVPPLYGLWDNPGNDWATPTIGTDNQRGYALASMVQKGITWTNFPNEFWNTWSPGDLNTYRCFVFSMWITGEPQYIGVRGEGGGHALVAWKCAYRSIHIADPNFPGNDTRWINYGGIVSNRFDPYYSGPDASDLGHAYTNILYKGKTTVIDWNMVGALWEQARAGTIGAGTFPLVTINVYDDDDTLAGTVTNTMAGGIANATIRGSRFRIRAGTGWDASRGYRPDGASWVSSGGWRMVEGVTNRIGLELFKEVQVGTEVDSTWVGFQWLDVIARRLTVEMTGNSDTVVDCSEGQEPQVTVFTARVTSPYTGTLHYAWTLNGRAVGGDQDSVAVDTTTCPFESVSPCFPCSIEGSTIDVRVEDSQGAVGMGSFNWGGVF